MFYTYNVDISSPKSMWNFLHDHYSYYTMNSWNRTRSIAHNVKLYNLNLDGDWTKVLPYLFNESDVGCLQMYIDDEISEFVRKNPCYNVGFNGRSGGYLVLYSDSCKSMLPDCVDNYESYEDFKEDCKCWGYRVSDYLRELRDTVEVVREFDRLCDRLRDLVNSYSKKSFDVDKLEYALTRFGDIYGDDLEDLNLDGPCMEGDRVRLNDIADYTAFMHCFFDCFGEDRRRIAYHEGYLWLKES